MLFRRGDSVVEQELGVRRQLFLLDLRDDLVLLLVQTVSLDGSANVPGREPEIDRDVVYLRVRV